MTSDSVEAEFLPAAATADDAIEGDLTLATEQLNLRNPMSIEALLNPFAEDELVHAVYTDEELIDMATPREEDHGKKKIKFS